MKTTQFAAPLLQCAKLLGLSALVVFGALSLTSNVARADTIFDFSGTVGNNYLTDTPYEFTGLTETGTITINTVTGTVDAIDLTVEGDPNIFTSFFGCPSNCTYNFNNDFDEFGLLDIGSDLVGYTGGAIGSDSYVALDTPDLGSGEPEVQYYLSGTVSAASVATPEPRYYTALLGLVLVGSLVVVRRRRLA
jgi:MYXO-CTERM domain-containing protein